MNDSIVQNVISSIIVLVINEVAEFSIKYFQGNTYFQNSSSYSKVDKPRFLLIPIILMVALIVISALGLLPWIWCSITITLILFLKYIKLYSAMRKLQMIGVIGADVTIRDGLNYEQALKSARKSISFLGIGGSKLTSNEDLFREVLVKLNPDDEIQILLLNPEHEALVEAAKKAGAPEKKFRESVQRSIDKIVNIKNERSLCNLKIRLYDEFPTFRIMIIDREQFLVSTYFLGRGDGSELPQIRLIESGHSGDVSSSIAFAFRAHYRRLWNSATEVGINKEP